jgi:hypothetical protein
MKTLRQSENDHKGKGLQSSSFSISASGELEQDQPCGAFKRRESCPPIISGPKQSKQMTRTMSVSFNENVLLQNPVYLKETSKFHQRNDLIVVLQGSFKKLADFILSSPKRMAKSTRNTLYISYKTLCSNSSSRGGPLLLLTLTIQEDIAVLTRTCGHGRLLYVLPLLEWDD